MWSDCATPLITSYRRPEGLLEAITSTQWSPLLRNGGGGDGAQHDSLKEADKRVNGTQPVEKLHERRTPVYYRVPLRGQQWNLHLQRLSRKVLLGWRHRHSIQKWREQGRGGGFGYRNENLPTFAMIIKNGIMDWRNLDRIQKWRELRGRRGGGPRTAINIYTCNGCQERYWNEEIGMVFRNGCRLAGAGKGSRKTREGNGTSRGLEGNESWRLHGGWMIAFNVVPNTPPG